MGRPRMDPFLEPEEIGQLARDPFLVAVFLIRFFDTAVRSFPIEDFLSQEMGRPEILVRRSVLGIPLQKIDLFPSPPSMVATSKESFDPSPLINTLQSGGSGYECASVVRPPRRPERVCTRQILTKSDATVRTLSTADLCRSG